MPRRRPLSPEQLQEIREAARRLRTTAGWTEPAGSMPTDPGPKKPESPAASSTTDGKPRTQSRHRHFFGGVNGLKTIDGGSGATGAGWANVIAGGGGASHMGRACGSAACRCDAAVRARNFA